MTRRALSVVDGVVVYDSADHFTRPTPTLSPHRGAVVFTWDDGYTDTLTVADLHEQRGQRITIGVTKNLVGNANHMSAAEIQGLATAGHELAAHSLSHQNFVSTLDAADRATDHAQTIAYVESLSGRTCTSFIYPFGGAARNATTDQECHLRYDRWFDTQIATSACVYPLGEAQPLMARTNLDGTAAGMGCARAMIRQAATRPVVAVFYCHRLDQANAPTTAQYTELLDLCVDLEVPVLPADEVFPGASILGDPGFEDPDLGGWLKVTSGDGAAVSVADTPAAGLPGSRSLHLSCTTGFVYVTQSIPVTAGRTYTLSGRYRTSAGASTSLSWRARQYRADATQINGSNIGSVMAESTSWARGTVDLTAHAEAARWAVDILYQPGAAGEAWVDHLHFGPKAFGAYG